MFSPASNKSRHFGYQFGVEFEGIKIQIRPGRYNPSLRWWWKKSQTTTWDVQNPISNGISYLSNGAGFLPSSVFLLFGVFPHLFWRTPTKSPDISWVLSTLTRNQPIFCWLICDPTRSTLSKRQKKKHYGLLDLYTADVTICLLHRSYDEWHNLPQTAHALFWSANPSKKNIDLHQVWFKRPLNMCYTPPKDIRLGMDSLPKTRMLISFSTTTFSGKPAL